MLRDCCFVFLKLSESNLYLQLMEYERLEESKGLLVFLELLHDYIQNAERSSRIEKENFSRNPSGRNISEYAASVISKISGLLNDRNYNSTNC